MRYVALLVALSFWPADASTQVEFHLQFDHSTVLVSDLEASAAFYENVLHLEALETPWGPAAPIRFFSIGGDRQLHVGVTTKVIEPDKNAHFAFAVRDFDAFLRFLMDAGIEYSDFPGSSSEVQVRPDGVRQIYLQDPDGNWIEINDVEHPSS